MLSATLLSLGLAGVSYALPAHQPAHVRRACDDGNTDALRSVFFSGPNYIGSASFDPTTNTFAITSNDTVAGAPTWLALDQGRVYAVNEGANDTSVFQVGNGNELTNIQAVNGSQGIVHLEFNGDKTVLFGAGFSNGDIDIFDIGAEGQLENHRSLKSEGSPGPNEARQVGPNVHQVVRDPSGDFIVFNDLGFDSVSVIGKKSADSDFEILSSVLTSQPGCGPRHGAFFPVGGTQATHYFLACEMLSIVEVFEVTYTDGVMSLSQTGRSASMFPTEGEFALNDIGAAGEIFVSLDNAHVYATNRLSGNPTDSIAHFAITGMTTEVQENGDIVAMIGDVNIELVDLVSSGGLLPRMFSLSKDGNTVFLANQMETEDKTAKGLVAFNRDPETGSLSELGSIPHSVFDAAGGLRGPAFVQEV